MCDCRSLVWCPGWATSLPWASISWPIQPGNRSNLARLLCRSERVWQASSRLPRGILITIRHPVKRSKTSARFRVLEKGAGEESTRHALRWRVLQERWSRILGALSKKLENGTTCVPVRCQQRQFWLGCRQCGSEGLGRRRKDKGRRGSRVPVVTTKEEVPGGQSWRYKRGWQMLRVLGKQRVGWERTCVLGFVWILCCRRY